MTITIGKKVWTMSKEEYQRLLKVASEQVPFGIYAIEKNKQAELRNDRCSSMGELKKLSRTFKSQGYKVYVNKEKADG